MGAGARVVRQSAAVWAPEREAGFTQIVRYIAEGARGDVDDVEVVVAAAVGREGDPGPVTAERRPQVAAGVAGQPEITPVEPDLGNASVGKPNINAVFTFAIALRVAAFCISNQ